MPIDVMNHMWVSVFSACYVGQIRDRIKEGRGPADERTAVQFAEEAAAVADQAMEAYPLIDGPRR